MPSIETIIQKLSMLFQIDELYIKLLLVSLEILIIAWILKTIIKKAYSKVNVSGKKKFFHNKNLQRIINTATVILLIFVWNEQLQNLMTLISFISAGVAIAIKDVIINFFAGIYIKFNRPFELEDRIEIDNVKGDVINLHALGFEILEIEERINGEQSTGRIIHIPNSYIFEKPLKNYVKAFKYIWDELVINVEMDSDLDKTKEIIYDILKEDDVLKTIPKKMEDAIDDVTVEYRIYYNELEPIIYTEIQKDHIALSIRFLVHPKKSRDVENHIYEKIIEKANTGEIKLYSAKNEKEKIKQ